MMASPTSAPVTVIVPEPVSPAATEAKSIAALPVLIVLITVPEAPTFSVAVVVSPVTSRSSPTVTSSVETKSSAVTEVSEIRAPAIA